MARVARVCLPRIRQHIIQRGNKREVCFSSDEDHAACLHWFAKEAKKCRMAIHACFLNTNHVHLLATSETRDGLSKMMQAIGRQHVL